MNLLVDAPPVDLDVAGRVYPIRSDFRSCLRIILAFEDNELTPQEKQVVMLSNLYPTPPEDPEAAVARGLWFLNGGQDMQGQSAGPRLYSFSKDANLVYAAFRQTHGIDLHAAQLHWWEFLALFMDMGGETTFCNLINLRRRVKSGQASKEEKQAARDMGDAFDVPEIDDRTLDEKDAEAEFLRRIGQGEH